jgi:hypothetical protein
MLFGCGGPVRFAKDGAGNPELQYDIYECRQQWERSSQGIAFRADPLNNIYYGINARSEMQECLQHKGWQPIEEQ